MIFAEKFNTLSLKKSNVKSAVHIQTMKSTVQTKLMCITTVADVLFNETVSQ